MILGIGCDVVEVARLYQLMQRFKPTHLRKIFTTIEIEYAHNTHAPSQTLAKRFAAKEAFVKALGTGKAKGIKWTDIEVRNCVNGQPILHITGQSLQIMMDKVPTGMSYATHLSLSDTKTLAQAYVIIEAKPA